MASLLHVAILAASVALPSVKDGDIIFQSSRSHQSTAIEAATHSPLTHVGIIYYRDGKPYVYEANRGMQMTPLNKWIRRGKGARYVLKRLRGEALTGAQLESMRRAGEALRNKPYDALFAWSDDAIYCSELVWKIYSRGAGIELSVPQRFEDLDLASKAVKELARARYGRGKIPLQESIVSPRDLYESAELLTVWDGFGKSAVHGL